MAIDYETFFDITKVFASSNKKTVDHNTDIDLTILHAMETMKDSATNANELEDLLGNYRKWESKNVSYGSRFESLYGTWLSGDGRDIIGSASTTTTNIATDLESYMSRDAETVLTNTIGNSIAYSRAGDGVVSTLTQDYLTRNDVITLICTTAQTISVDAVFAVRTRLEGNLTETVTADGATSFSKDVLGITGLIVDAGTVANYWALADQIVITTTSDDRSILLDMFRDFYTVALPTSATPTISNTLADVQTTFPGSPVDGQEVVINGVLYRYSLTSTEWVEAC